MEEKKQYMIQLEAGKSKSAISSLRRKLKQIGIDVDEKYGPVPVNRDLGRYVIRGWATPDDRTRAEKLKGVTFFGDPKIAPVQP